MNIMNIMNIKKNNNNLLLLKILLLLMFVFLLCMFVNKSISMNTNTSMNHKETYEDIKTMNAGSDKCKTKADLVDFCINYDSCCGANSPNKDCVCNHPFVQNCKTNFTNCLNTNPNKLSESDLMNNCIESNKTCCNAYNNNLSIKSSAFSKYNKPNDPVIRPLCNLTNVNDIDQKCLELCTTTPKCVAYSLLTGVIASDYGRCSLYDTVNYAEHKVNKDTGKDIPFLSDYYTKN
jgi:hypothetical protein